MKRVKWVACLFFVLAVLAIDGTSPPGAMDRNGYFFASGIGAKSCDDYLRVRDKRLGLTTEQYRIAEHVIEHWMAGFLTAHNFYVLETYSVQGNSSVQDMQDRIEDYCREKPNDYFAQAAIDLTRRLHANRFVSGALTGR
jgi:hypothetical protein